MNTFSARIIGLSLAIAVGIFFIFGCGGSSTKGTNPPPVMHSAKYHDVSIANFAFSPAALTIAVGDTVNWTNNQNVTHTVTSDTGSELSGNLAPGAQYLHVFTTAGSFPYHCTIHTFMTGSVTVQ